MAIAEQIADAKRIMLSDDVGVATSGATTKHSAPTLAVTTNQSDATIQWRSLRCLCLSSFLSSIFPLQSKSYNCRSKACDDTRGCDEDILMIH